MIKADKIFKYRLRLSKSESAITRHEERKMLLAALQSSGLDLAPSKDKPKLTLGPGAAPGEASLCEFADICLKTPRPEGEIKNLLAPLVSGGYELQEVKEVPYMLSSVEVLAQYAKYKITLPAGVEEEITLELSALRSLGPAQMLQTLRGLGVEDAEPIKLLRVALLWRDAAGALRPV